jgi:hypothetical protein
VFAVGGERGLKLGCAVLLAAGKKTEGVQVPADQQPVFSISPEKVLLTSKEATTFMITGLSSRAGGSLQQWCTVAPCCAGVLIRVHVADSPSLRACAGAISEQLQCQAVNTGGGAAAPGGAKPKPMFDITASAEVATPLLQLSKQAVEFSYIHAEGQHPVMQEPLEVR